VDIVDDELNGLLASTVAPLGLELVDVERRTATVRVVLDRPGGADLDAIAEATRLLSAVLDGHDPYPGRRYTLEVSTPGVERPLRTPAHFSRAVGETVSVRTLAGGQGERRVTGLLESADDEGFVLRGDDLPGGSRRLSYREVERARTVFEWGASSRAGQRRGRRDGRPGAGGGPRAGTRRGATKRKASATAAPARSGRGVTPS